MTKCLLCDYDGNDIILKTKDMDPREVGIKDLFELAKCKNCGLVYVANKPSKKDIARYYGEEYYAKKDISNSIMSRIAMASRSRKIPKNIMGSILDYGCGNGDFLFEMKRNGWEVRGVEFSDDARRIAGKNIGIEIINDKDTNKIKGSFDAITMWHVLEHLYEPSDTLKELRKLLKKTGLLTISVPNIKSLQFYLFGKNTFHLDIPRHVAHYSPETIKRLLEQNGFKVAGFNQYSIEYNPFGFVQSFLNSIGCEFNFLYNVLKRGYKRRISMVKFTYSLLATFILLPFLILIAIPWTYFESMIGYGASFVVYAKNE